MYFLLALTYQLIAWHIPPLIPFLPLITYRYHLIDLIDLINLRPFFKAAYYANPGVERK